MGINIFNFKIRVPKAVIIILAPIAVLCIATIGYAIRQGDGTIIVSGSQEVSGESTSKMENSKADQTEGKKDTTQERTLEEEIKIYVTGCVKNEGIVVLKKGQIIDDAIKAAGGATEEADLSNINLVYKLTGNAMLKVKSKKETQPANNPKTGETKQGNSGGEGGTGVEIVKNDGGVVVNNTAPSGNSGGRININTASEEQLDTLPGIGISTAKDIITYREKSGPFKSINDIMKVPGIKESRFSKIKDLITVE